MIEITSSEDIRILDYSLLKSKEENPNLFIADHEKTVIRLLNSNLNIKSLYATEKYISKHIELINKKLDPKNIFFSSLEIFEKTIGFSVHQGMMAVGETPNMDSILELKNPILICNSLVDTQNLGSILRTSAAFGLNSIVLDEKCVSPFLRRSVRVSMGNLFFQYFYRSNNLFRDIKIWKNKGFKILGLSLPDHGLIKDNFIKIGEFIFPEKFILILGNESNGIDKRLINDCDSLIYIPMYGGVDSLNVSHSLAVALSFWKKGQ